MDPRFLDLRISLRWVVSFTPRPLYPRGKRPWYPQDRRWDRPHSHSGWHGERKFLTLLGLELQPLCHPVASCYTSCTIPAPNTATSITRYRKACRKQNKIKRFDILLYFVSCTALIFFVLPYDDNPGWSNQCRFLTWFTRILHTVLQLIQQKNEN
jgi:hypothetical protein